MEFKVFQKEIELQSRGWIPTFHDVTEEIEKIVAATAETHLLTNRELEVFCELLKGKKQSEIGYYLGISISTVKDNAGRIYGKLGVANKDELFIKIDSKLRKS